MFRFIAALAALAVHLLWPGPDVVHGLELSADCGTTSLTPDDSGSACRFVRCGGEVSPHDAPGKVSVITDHRAQPPPAQLAW